MHETVRPGRATAAAVVTYADGRAKAGSDDVATEEPLEIRLRAGGRTRSLAVTMRTPGNDFELAAGFLFAEGVIAGRDAITAIDYCLDPDLDDEQRYNIVTIDVAARELPELDRLERHFVTGSACGVCGRASIEAVRERGVTPVDDALELGVERLYELPERMREGQRIFAATGGLHAAALFDEDGALLALREDVGRHNALDKLAGWGVLQGRLPFARTVLLVSGRSSYEIVQKAASARIPILCGVSAPSSLAVSMARELGITLVGFLRGRRCNVYANDRRLRAGP